ncbi:MAG: energy transducer TonB [Campylobacterales bacterium]
MSKNLNLALLVSLLLHILLILVLMLFEKKQKESEEKYTPIGNIPLKMQEEAKLPTSPPPKPKTPPTPKSKPQEIPATPPQPQPPAKKEPPKEEVKKEVKEQTPKEEVPKRVKEEVKKPAPKKEKPKPKDSNQIEQSPRKSNLESFLSSPSSPQEPSIDDIANSFTDNKIEKLYGKEFGSFTKEQKEFIRDNLSKIGQITQKHLKYPNLAGELQQDGQNIVEFYLHPNGNITELRLIGKTGYAMLDRNSIKTIEIAYKDYPRPKSKTKIRIYVNYILY